ncbi:helix-turn-helix domain-containing protein [Streptomyces sp. NBC_00669]|uniref:helix-turn-helix domain-containing protein n=1 Tax=Streptomyces sp. NBC_00669 TaxID=2976011 RepID=UPI002E366DA3|nr:helix-turn-helix transcriptional regulator [Streptomyces sp. NBC_00669]
MAAKRGATFRRRELGKELRKLREKRDLTIQEVARELKFSHSKLARVEIGENDLPRVGAEAMRAYQPSFVFGFFQTEAYARALYQLAKPIDETTTEYVDTNVQLRMERKELITRSVDPVKLRVIMDESAVRRMVASREVMREQYAEIVAMGELENVTIQILPHDVLTYRTESNFVLIDFSETLAPVVQIDQWNTISVSDERSDVLRTIRRFDAMRDSALPPAHTAGFLKKLTTEWT